MPLEIIVAPDAERDLEDILEFIAADNPSAAGSLAESFDKAIALLAEFPYMGSGMHIPLRKGFRKVTVLPHLVIYRVTSNAVQIVRVVHSSRDLPSLLKYL